MSKQERALGVDALRVIAAAAVVWIHTPQAGTWWAGTTSLSRFAVPLFACVAGYGLAASMLARPGEGVWTVTWRRFVRLYVPFLAWGAVYLGLRLLKRGGEVEWSLSAFLTVGPAQQLWFLPFVFAAGVPCAVVVALVRDRAWARRAAGSAALMAGVAIGVAEAAAGFRTPGGLTPTGWQVGLNLAYQATPALVWGLGAALLTGRGLGALRVPGWAGLAALAGAGACVWLGWRHDPIEPKSCALENVSGVLVLVAALAAPTVGVGGRAVARLAAWGPLAYGIYLAHIVFLQAGQMALARFGAGPTLAGDLALLASATVASAVLTWWLRRGRATRWMAPG